MRRTPFELDVSDSGRAVHPSHSHSCMQDMYVIRIHLQEAPLELFNCT